MSNPGNRAIEIMLEVFAPPQPFAPEEDSHAPFELTRRTRQVMLPPPMPHAPGRRPLWTWVAVGFVLWVCLEAVWVACRG